MRLVVDLNDEVYNNMVVKNSYTRMDVIAVHTALMVAIHIPKGHGRLIDADALQKQAIKVKLEHIAREIEVVTKNQIKEAAAIPIIEADTTRDCKTCGHSKDGKCAGTEECHDCMWESNYIEADKGCEKE